jgi:hypothetical protein
MTRPTVFISHSAQGDAKVWPLCEHAREYLLAHQLGVFLDSHSLTAGSAFRAEIHQNLFSCDGAVIFLSSRALDSAWVLSEVNLLGWRKRNNPQFPLLPIVVDGLSPDDPRMRAFEPVQLAEIQFLRTSDPLRIERELARVFAALPSGPEDDRIRAWIEDICVALEGVAAPHLCRAAERLGIAQLAHCDAALLRRRLACELLRTDNLIRVRDALHALKHGMSEAQLRMVIARVEPNWVNVTAASNLLHIFTQVATIPFAAINGQRTDTGDHYIRRATCCTDESYRIAVSAVTGEGRAAELIDQYTKAIARAFGLEFASLEEVQAALRDEQSKVYLILPSPATSEEVLVELAAAFPNTAFVLLTGTQLPKEGAYDVVEVKSVLPPLGPSDEQLAHSRARRLRTILEKSHHGYDSPNQPV